MTTYKDIRTECEEAGAFTGEKCMLNRGLVCNGYKCPVLHYFRGTRHSGLLDKFGLSEQYAEDME